LADSGVISLSGFRGFLFVAFFFFVFFFFFFSLNKIYLIKLRHLKLKSKHKEHLNICKEHKWKHVCLNGHCKWKFFFFC